MRFISRAKDVLYGALRGGALGRERLNTAELMADEAAAESGYREARTENGLAAVDPLAAGIAKVFEGAFQELEASFANEDRGWIEGAGPSTFNFTRQTLRKIVGLSRVMYLINPLIKRIVTVQELYVWGRGVKIIAENPEVQEVLDDFFKARKNQRVIGDAWAEREREQRIDGNTFFVFYWNKLNGAARVRLLPFDQIQSIIFNPEDAKEPYFYVRSSNPAQGNGLIVQDGTLTDVVEETTLYPDWDYKPRLNVAKVPGNYKIAWNTCTYHLKTGGLSMMRFGMPELFSAFGWATGYKRILENFATILAAYARLAYQVSGLQGKAGVAASKNKLKTGVTNSQFRDNNPPTNTASWALMSGAANVQPIKTAGSTTGPDEARALRSMVAAGGDTPEHFLGDSDIGNFATSSTLDRPTELKMVSRQDMWADVCHAFAEKLIQQSALAPQGKLRKAGYTTRVDTDPFDGSVIITVLPPSGKSTVVKVEFPNILERDVTDRVRSVVQAVTLGGSPAEGIIPDRKVVCGMLLEALGEQDADRLTELLYPKSVTQGFADPANRVDDEHLIALGRKELGDAALQQAAAAKINAAKPTPKPSGSPAGGGKSGR
jgi:hypothetical protein